MAERNWNAVIEDVVKGRWTDPATGKPAKVPFETIFLAESLDVQRLSLPALRIGVVPKIRALLASGVPTQFFPGSQ